MSADWVRGCPSGKSLIERTGRRVLGHAGRGSPPGHSRHGSDRGGPSGPDRIDLTASGRACSTVRAVGVDLRPSLKTEQVGCRRRSDASRPLAWREPGNRAVSPGDPVNREQRGGKPGHPAPRQLRLHAGKQWMRPDRTLPVWRQVRRRDSSVGPAAPAAGKVERNAARPLLRQRAPTESACHALTSGCGRQGTLRGTGIASGRCREIGASSGQGRPLRRQDGTKHAARALRASGVRSGGEPRRGCFGNRSVRKPER